MSSANPQKPKRLRLELQSHGGSARTSWAAGFSAAHFMFPMDFQLERQCTGEILVLIGQGFYTVTESY